VQKRRCATCAERGLRSAAAESSRQIRAFARLNKDDEDQKDADDDVQNDKQYGHESLRVTPMEPDEPRNSSRKDPLSQGVAEGRCIPRRIERNLPESRLAPPHK